MSTVHRPADHRSAPAAPTVATRPPTAMDQLELEALARRVGDVVPEQPLLVAALDGRVVAARSVRTGVTIGDAGEHAVAVGAALRARADA